MRRLSGLLVALVLLAGCVSRPPVSEPVATTPPVADPQHCGERAECTTKVSRTLLFIFDYAAQGAPLVQREGRLLFTPVDAHVSDWPAVTIRLAEAEHSRFDFHGQCRASACRLSVEQLLAIYRSYLADRPCAFSDAPCHEAQTLAAPR